MTSPVLAQGVVRKFFSQRVQILHSKLDQYSNFQCPGIIGSILECGLLLTFPFLPMPDLNVSRTSPENTNFFDSLKNDIS